MLSFWGSRAVERMPRRCEEAEAKSVPSAMCAVGQRLEPGCGRSSERGVGDLALRALGDFHDAVEDLRLGNELGLREAGLWREPNVAVDEELANVLEDGHSAKCVGHVDYQ